MWKRLIVTSLLVVGARFAPMSFSGARSVTAPISSNIVGHGTVVVHGEGEVTLVITSDNRLVVCGPGVPAPRAAVSKSITR